MKGPTIQRPIHLAGSGSSDPINKSADNTPPVKVKNVGGISELFIAAAVGAVASYFVPKLLDRYMPSQLDPNHGDDVTLDIGDDG